MLDLVVLIAMAVTAAAFAAGLIIQSGIAQIPALIAAASLYMVMAASYLMVTRATRSAPVTDRLNELEEALEIIDGDLQRIDRVEDDVARLDLLNDRVERLDQAVADYGSNETVGGLARFDQFATEFEEVHTRIEGLRADLEGEARNQRDKIANDLRALEGVIKQLSRDMAAASAASAAAREAPAAAPEPSAPIAKPEAKQEFLADTPAETLTVFEVEVEDEEEIVEFAEPDKDVVPLEEEGAARGASQRVGDGEMLEIIAHAIEEGRVDLYLQPTVMLPERRPRYYEAFTRIRTKADDLILPAAYLPVAEGSGMMPLIDNVLLVKSVQVLRRLSADSRIKGIFCNISVQTLLDPEFFPELVEFMEENSSLSESLTFEVSQPAILALGPAELGSLDTLGALGYGFCLDHVADLDVDFMGLRDRHFRFVKIEAKTFLRGMEDGGASLAAADLKRYLEGFDLKLIVEKIKDESTVAKLLDYGVELAQGYVFGKPQPMSPALSRELEDADAA
jgi:cyclic-di-GMP phosphodiesterase, flagellum assembly factor TipF